MYYVLLEWAVLGKKKTVTSSYLGVPFAPSPGSHELSLRASVVWNLEGIIRGEGGARTGTTRCIPFLSRFYWSTRCWAMSRAGFHKRENIRWPIIGVTSGDNSCRERNCSGYFIFTWAPSLRPLPTLYIVNNLYQPHLYNSSYTIHYRCSYTKFFDLVVTSDNFWFGYTFEALNIV